MFDLCTLRRVFLQILICSIDCFSGGSPDSRRLTQLNILYNARGRKIEELDRELKKTKEESDREIRILKHKVALAEGIALCHLCLIFVFYISISFSLVISLR